MKKGHEIISQKFKKDDKIKQQGLRVVLHYNHTKEQLTALKRNLLVLKK